jgi:uncharacterized phage protein gp47/JayE
MPRILADRQLLKHAAARKYERLAAAHAVRVRVVVAAGFLVAGVG